MRKKIVLLLFAVACSVLAARAADKRFTLVIDAGHGGHDAGALGAFSKEKTINLNVALAFGRYVEANCPDVKVIYTRKTDVFIPLHQRADIANRNKADLFVSIHTNALPKGKVSRGMETYTLGMHRASDNLEVAKRENSVILVEKDYKQRYAGFDPRSSESYIMFELIQDNNMSQSVEMAKLVQQKVCGLVGRPNKGVKQAGFLVLRETSMPSCLIELGFVTTPDEERLLNDKSKIDAIGKGIYQAFVAYKKKVSPGARAQAAPPKAEPPRQEASPATPESPKPAPRPVVAEESASPAPAVADTPEVAPPDTLAASVPQPVTVDAAPVFMVQVAASPTPMNVNDRYFRGRTDVEHFEDGGLHKYAIGASADYETVRRLCNQLQSVYNTPFVVAFKNGQKVDKDQAVREWRANRNGNK